MEAAGAGDTVRVEAGRYRENLVITKSLILQGVGRDQVTLEPADPLVPLLLIHDAQVVVSGFTLQGGAGGRQRGDFVGVRAIQIKGTSQAQILYNRIIGPTDGKGIDVTGAAQVRIAGNEIRDSSFGIIVGQESGVFLPEGVGQALILDNDIFGHSMLGILGSDLVARGNRIHNNDIGLDVRQAYLWKNRIFANKQTGVQASNYAVELVENEIFENEDGVMLFRGYMYGLNNDVYDNRRWGFTLWSDVCGFEYGVLKPTEVLVEGVGNIVSRNGSGAVCPATSPPWPQGFYVEK
jgi:nitrous oxidase accessory protein NosD